MRRRDQERLIGRYLSWSFGQVTGRGCLLLVVLLALVAVCALVFRPSRPSHMSGEVVEDAAAPTARPDAGRPRVRKPAAAGTATSHYDERGLVDGGIPGAPPGWKPVAMPPLPDGG